MLGLESVTAWTAVGTSAFAALVVLLGLALGLRWRNASERRLQGVLEASSRSEELLAELTKTLDQAQFESEEAREQGERAKEEARRLRILGRLGAALDLDSVADGALEHAAEEVGSDAAALVLVQTDAEPFSASFGLSPDESERELVGMPPDLNEARAVTIRYRYSQEEAENDVFRLTAGLAVPLHADGRKIGTLAVFWRRSDRDATDEQVAALEDVAKLLAGPLETARRYEESRRLADLDPLTGLQNERYFADRLLREVSRARRYERRLSLLIFRFPVATGSEGGLTLLGTVGRRVRSAVRSADVACHLGDSQFAVILPEVGTEEAEQLHRRLQFAVGSRLGGGTSERIEFPAAVVELEPDDNADSLLHRGFARLGAEERTTEDTGEAASAETRG